MAAATWAGFMSDAAKSVIASLCVGTRANFRVPLFAPLAMSNATTSACTVIAQRSATKCAIPAQRLVRGSASTLSALSLVEKIVIGHAVTCHVKKCLSAGINALAFVEKSVRRSAECVIEIRW